MTRWLWAVLAAAVVTAGCDPKKAPEGPAPKTAQADREMRAVAEAAPASDPSLPQASAAFPAISTGVAVGDGAASAAINAPPVR